MVVGDPYFLFSPRNLGKISNLTSIFFRWVGEKPPTRKTIGCTKQCPWFSGAVELPIWKKAMIFFPTKRHQEILKIILVLVNWTMTLAKWSCFIKIGVHVIISTCCHVAMLPAPPCFVLRQASWSDGRSRKARGFGWFGFVGSNLGRRKRKMK